MQYFTNDPESAVEHALLGVLSFSGISLQRVATHLAVVYPENGNRKVKVVVGGGSGHEPLFLGIAGPGLADGAVAGQVFAAPAPDAIYAVIEAVKADEGVVLVYGNYSGDVFRRQPAAPATPSGPREPPQPAQEMRTAAAAMPWPNP
jgi:phosphoenolpyruvate---glycerone phosphotransferase subunit DhaK